jgi:hypothetical protein
LVRPGDWRHGFRCHPALAAAPRPPAIRRCPVRIPEALLQSARQALPRKRASQAWAPHPALRNAGILQRRRLACAHIVQLWQDANGYVIDPHDFKAKLTELWLATTKQPKQGKFSALIACIKPTHANFLSYSLKNVDETEHRNGKVDTLNCAGDALLAA